MKMLQIGLSGLFNNWSESEIAMLIFDHRINPDVSSGTMSPLKVTDDDLMQLVESLISL